MINLNYFNFWINHTVSYVKLFFQNCLYDNINSSNSFWIKESNSFTGLIIFSKLIG